MHWRGASDGGAAAQAARRGEGRRFLQSSQPFCDGAAAGIGPTQSLRADDASRAHRPSSNRCQSRCAGSLMEGPATSHGEASCHTIHHPAAAAVSEESESEGRAAVLCAASVAQARVIALSEAGLRRRRRGAPIIGEDQTPRLLRVGGTEESCLGLAGALSS